MGNNIAVKGKISYLVAKGVHCFYWILYFRFNGNATAAYMRCYATVGPEAFAIVAALQGDEDMEHFASNLLRRYVDAYAQAFRPYVEAPMDVLTIRCTAIVGAAEALSGVMLRNEIEEREAVSTLFSLITSWFGHECETTRLRS